jgi:hypothetical protein
VPHLNELHEKFDREGLTVLGITSESANQTDPWIKANSAHYGYAYDKGGRFSQRCGVRGIPSSVLLDPSGKVVYAGSPSGVTAELVKQATQGALKTPLYALPKELAKVRTLLTKDDLAGAIAEAKAVAAKPDAPAEAAAVAESLQAMVAGLLESADALGSDGNWLEAKRTLERVQKAGKGLPQEAQAKEKLAALASNQAAQKEIKAQTALEKILAMPTKKSKEREAQLAQLERFAEKNAESFAGKEAAKRLAELRKAGEGD